MVPSCEVFYVAWRRAVVCSWTAFQCHFKISFIYWDNVFKLMIIWQCRSWNEILKLGSLTQQLCMNLTPQTLVLFEKYWSTFIMVWPPLWSSGQSFWLPIQRSRVRFPTLPDFLSSSGSGTGSTQPREVNWGATWIKRSGSGPENRD